jgi:RNA polymerase sigma-70 factor (ECF subfamily)
MLATAMHAVETTRVQELFVEFRARPTTESLVALLRANQDRIYNICYQALRHSQDAEDASQDVLLELVEGCSQVRDPRAFQAWLYRVALNTALNHKKSRFARAELARRSAAMPTREDRSSDVMEALARLDDASRGLILEHYFEKATLEELAKREGLSVTGLWKRMERAKGKLRQSLVGAGCAVSAASLAHALEGVAPVSAPAGLVSGAVISKAALVAAGGLAVASKSVISGAAVILALGALSLGAGGGYWAGRKASPPVEIRTSISDSKPKAADPMPRVEFSAPPPPVIEPTPPEEKPPAPKAKVKFASATRSGGWEEFYEHANALGISFNECRSLVYKRLERELKLTDEEYTAMYKMVREEEEAVSKTVYAKYGEGDKLQKLLMATGSTSIWDDVRSIRDNVRLTFNPAYDATFTPEQVKAINDRLRGQNVIMHSENGVHSIRSLPGYME